MIIKGGSRSGGTKLGQYLEDVGENERIAMVEIRGTVAQDPLGALKEMAAYAEGTQCENALYHAMICPQRGYDLTSGQFMEAIDLLEKELGLQGQPRVVVAHEKDGGEHRHIVWSRIDLEQMKAIPDSHNYAKHERVARELERRYGHPHVQGAHAERDNVARPDRTPSRAELRQEERTGISGKEMKREVTEAFRASDNAEAFKAALEEKGYILAQGDRRDFVVVDRAGGDHSLARRIDGVKAKELREFMAPIDRAALPTVETARELQKRLEREAERSPSIEKAYARGDDYVSQTTAAMKEHKKRQDDLVAKYGSTDIAERLLKLRERYEAMSREGNGNEHSQDGDPDRQLTAPGGGHTRSL